jgi:hypothetical protein
MVSIQSMIPISANPGQLIADLYDEAEVERIVNKCVF